jgi:pimeloyl-ACP methyl ester carboxylesterase
MERTANWIHKTLPSSKMIIASQSGHNVNHDQPELVIEAIKQVVEAVRGR